MALVIKDTKFVASYPNMKSCPGDSLPEFAFIGRSNVGKSSLINMITNRRNLALTSATPGKTKMINFFLVNNNWYLVDLPGYGYAKISKESRGQFKKTLLEYIDERQNLYCLFVLVDARIPPQEIDIRFINRLGHNQIPFIIVLTKTDKISKNDIVKFVSRYSEILSNEWAELPNMIVTSAIKKTGREQILEIIEKAMKD